MSNMPSCCKKLAHIDTKTKYGVYGWMRKAEVELQLSQSPLMIANICVLYLYEEDPFDQTVNSTGISHDRRLITQTTHCSKTGMNYGTIVIDSNQKISYR